MNVFQYMCKYNEILVEVYRTTFRGTMCSYNGSLSGLSLKAATRRLNFRSIIFLVTFIFVHRFWLSLFTAYDFKLIVIIRIRIDVVVLKFTVIFASTTVITARLPF